jgi:hypothetical protein
MCAGIWGVQIRDRGGGGHGKRAWGVSTLRAQDVAFDSYNKLSTVDEIVIGSRGTVSTGIGAFFALQRADLVDTEHSLSIPVTTM